MSLSGVQAVAAGGKHFYALLQSGAVMAWGDNTYGELGDGTTTSSSSPAAVDLPSPAMAISSGNIFGDALLSNGELMTWGDNDFGQLGNPNVDSACNTNPNDTSWCSYVPVPVLNSSGMPLQGVTAISAGGDVKANGHNLALLTGGTVMAWGDNESGQLGNPSVTGICNPSDPVQKSLNPENMCTDVPVAVMGLPDIECMPDIQCIAAGGEHSMALSMDGDLYTWGDNSSGQLGDGTKTNEMLPEMVLTGVSEMAAGSKHSIALSTSS
jgi:alpha-tubulin suppressor-like RCC1 family protein